MESTTFNTEYLLNLKGWGHAFESHLGYKIFLLEKVY